MYLCKGVKHFKEPVCAVNSTHTADTLNSERKLRALLVGLMKAYTSNRGNNMNTCNYKMVQICLSG